jgi:L-lactate dehydrogenase (cytochrome)
MPPPPASIDDLRLRAQKRLPRFLFDFIDGAAGTESTHAANRSDLDQVGLRTRVLSGAGTPSLRTKILGRDSAAPFMIAPTGGAGMVRRHGELHGVRAAHAAGVGHCLSTMSSVTLEEVAKAAPECDRWFQLYLTRDRELARRFVERAKAAGFRVLMPTVDVPVQGGRRRDMRNGYTVPPRLSLRTVRDISMRLPWAREILLPGAPSFANFDAEGKGFSGAVSIAKAVSAQLEPCITLADIAWLKDLWGGKLVVKGVLDPADAEACVRAGADGVVVSNHGGRQLDGTQSSIRALAPVVDRIGHKAEVFLDGGISGGVDVLRALALGARAVLLGRAWLWGLAAGRQEGVATMLELVAEEMRIAMRMMGRDTVEIGREAALIPQDFLTWPNG